jgi:hypothetical protein
MASRKKLAIDLSLLSPAQRQAYDGMSEQEKAEFVGFGEGTRDDFDSPRYIAIEEEYPIQKGNCGIVLGLDRPNNILSGFGGSKDTHCAAVDIVAGRLGYRARSRNKRGKRLNVDPNFKLDAARIYVSQKSDPDSYFGLSAGTVGNTTPDSPRSTVALKADTLRFIARENIKLVTRTDKKNSQGGDLTNATTTGYGIDLIAMNDDGDMQPLVKGTNLQQCLIETCDAVHDLRELFKNFLEYNRQFTRALMTHTHRSPFYGQLTAPDFEIMLPAGVETIVNNLTNVEAQLMIHMQKVSGIKRTYLEVPGGAETTTDDKGLFILSKYNNTN